MLWRIRGTMEQLYHAAVASLTRYLDQQRRRHESAGTGHGLRETFGDAGRK